VSPARRARARRKTRRRGFALARARIPLQSPREPYLPGLLASKELSDIANAVIDERKRNTRAAEATQLSIGVQIASRMTALSAPYPHCMHTTNAVNADLLGLHRRKASLFASGRLSSETSWDPVR
jgi:hypothetical protein